MPQKFGKKVKETYELDFEGVGAGKRKGVRVSPGDYIVKVKAVVETNTKEKNVPQFNWTLAGLSGQLKGKEMFDRTQFKGGGSFKTRTMMLAAGFEAPQARKVKFSPKQMLGKVIGVTIDDNEWNGTTTSQVIDYFPVKVKKDGTFKRLPLPDENEFDREEEDVEDVEEDEDEEEEVEEEEESEEEEEVEEEDEAEEEEVEEEEEPKPAPKTKGKKGKK